MTDYYTPSANPVAQSLGRSSTIRAEFELIDTAFETVNTEMTAKAPAASPTFTGTVVLPATTSIGNVSATELAYLDGVTSAIQTQLNALVAVDATKAPTAGPTLTGAVNMAGASSVTAPTVTAGDNTTKVATTAFVTTAALSSVVPVTAPDSGKYLTNNGTAASWGSLPAYALIASPTFTGVPAADTAAAGTNTTQLATTEFVTRAVGGYAADAVGTYVLAYDGGISVAFGSTIAGSSLLTAQITLAGGIGSGTALSGTWRRMGYGNGSQTTSLYVRIS